MLLKPINATPNHGLAIDATLENTFFTTIEGSSSIVTAYEVTIYDGYDFDQVYTTGTIQLDEPLYAGELLNVIIPAEDNGMENGRQYYWVIRLFQEKNEIFVTDTVIIDNAGTTLRIRWNPNIKSGMSLKYQNKTRIILDYVKDGETAIVTIGSPINFEDSDSEYVTTSWDQGRFRVITPDIAPNNSLNTLAWSPDSEILAVGQTTWPYLTFYKLDDGSLVKIPSPEALPDSSVNSVAWTNDGKTLLVGTSLSPHLFVYAYDGNTFVNGLLPDYMPQSKVTSIDCSMDNKYIAIGCQYAPYILAYSYETSTDTEFGIITRNPEIPLAANGQVNAVSFSSDSRFLAIGSSVQPHAVTYSITDDIFSIINTSQPVVNGAVQSISWGHTTNYLQVAFAHVGTPYITAWYVTATASTSSSNVFRRVSSGVGGSANTTITSGTAINYIKGGNYAAYGFNSTPYFSIYTGGGQSLQKKMNPAQLPAGTVNSLRFTPNGRYLAVASSSEPYLFLYTTTNVLVSNSSNSDIENGYPATIYTNYIDSLQFPFWAMGTIGLEIINIPEEPLDSRKYEFLMQYNQPEDSPIKWHRFIIYDQLKNIIHDTNRVYSSDLTCYFDGFITGQSYYIEGFIENANSNQAQTILYKFDVYYNAPALDLPTGAQVFYVDNAILVRWGRNVWSHGKTDPPEGGNWHIEENVPFDGTNSLVIDEGTVYYDDVAEEPISVTDNWTLMTDITINEFSQGKVLQIEDTINALEYYVFIRGGKFYYYKDGVETFLYQFAVEEWVLQPVVNPLPDTVYLWYDRENWLDHYYWVETLPFTKRFKITMLPDTVLIKEIF